MRQSLIAAALAMLVAGAADAQAPAEVLFRNVRVFDGKAWRADKGSCRRVPV